MAEESLLVKLKNNRWCFRAFFLWVSYALTVLSLYSSSYFYLFNYQDWASAALTLFSVCLLGPRFAYTIDGGNLKWMAVTVLVLIGLIQGAAYYIFLPNWAFLLTRMCVGMLGGLAVTLIYCTIMVNVVPSAYRDRCCLIGNGYGMLGINFGIMFTSFYIDLSQGYQFNVVPYSCLFVWIAALLISTLKIKFRAPLGVKKWSFDRFFQFTPPRVIGSLSVCSVAVGVMLGEVDDFSWWLYAFLGGLLANYRLHRTRQEYLRPCIEAGYCLTASFLLAIFAYYVNTWYQQFYFLCGIPMGYGLRILWHKGLEYIFYNQKHDMRSTTLSTLFQLTTVGIAVGIALAALFRPIFPWNLLLVALAVGGVTLSLKWYDWK